MAKQKPIDKKRNELIKNYDMYAKKYYEKIGINEIFEYDYYDVSTNTTYKIPIIMSLANDKLELVTGYKIVAKDLSNNGNSANNTITSNFKNYVSKSPTNMTQKFDIHYSKFEKSFFDRDIIKIYNSDEFKNFSYDVQMKIKSINKSIYNELVESLSNSYLPVYRFQVKKRTNIKAGPFDQRDELSELNQVILEDELKLLAKESLRLLSLLKGQGLVKDVGLQRITEIKDDITNSLTGETGAKNQSEDIYIKKSERLFEQLDYIEDVLAEVIEGLKMRLIGLQNQRNQTYDQDERLGIEQVINMYRFMVDDLEIKQKAIRGDE